VRLYLAIPDVSVFKAKKGSAEEEGFTSGSGVDLYGNKFKYQRFEPNYQLDDDEWPDDSPNPKWRGGDESLRRFAKPSGGGGKESGEGSRGGHITGHTSSGKPIYAKKSAPHLYLAIVEEPALVLKGIDPVKWARTFDHTNRDYPRSDADLADERHDQLYLNTNKANPHRDPSIGTFISGGAGRAKSGEGQHDLSGLMTDLMNTKPGLEELKKQ